MADKKRENAKNTAAEKPPVKKKRFRFLVKSILVLLVLAALAGGSLYAAVYFKFFDPYELAEKYKLTEYPVIGRYFVRPATNFEPVELPEEKAPQDKPAAEPAPKQAQAPPAAPPAATAEEIKAALAKAKQEEAKRISRLARLYGEMNPDDAVPILNQLDDKTVLAIFAKMEDAQVAKLMTLLDARRAARLTQDMMKGPPAQAIQDGPKGIPTT